MVGHNIKCCEFPKGAGDSLLVEVGKAKGPHAFQGSLSDFQIGISEFPLLLRIDGPRGSAPISISDGFGIQF